MKDSGQELIPLVRLYRAINMPKVNGVEFSCKHLVDENIFNILLSLWSNLEKFGSRGKVELTIDKAPFTLGADADLDKFKNDIVDEEVDINVTLRQNSSIRFYRNVDHLIEKQVSTHVTNFPQFYYLIEEDYCHGMDNITQRPKDLKTIDHVFDFIDKLTSLANKVDKSSDNIIATFYVSDSENKNEVLPTDIPMAFDAALKTVLIPTFSILKEVTDLSFSNPHSFEKKILLKSALCEVYKNKPDSINAIQYLIAHWADVEKTYHRNLETFITGISFSKLKHEVEERNLAFLDDINSALVDISMKLTALPASFGLWIFIVREDHTIIKMWGFFFALFLMTLILNAALAGHVAKFEHIKRKIKSQLDQLTVTFNASVKDQVVNQDIHQSIKNTRDILDKQTKRIGKSLSIYGVLIWLPVIVVFVTIMYRYFSC